MHSVSHAAQAVQVGTHILMKFAHVMTDGNTSSAASPSSGALRTTVRGGFKATNPPIGSLLAPVKKLSAFRCIVWSNSEMMEIKCVIDGEVRE